MEGHTHANKADLDKLGVTQDGYVTVTDKAENEGGAVTAKARAGEADEAAHAASAAALDADSPTREDFLSAKDDDTAQGNITFAKDIDVKGGEKVGEKWGQWTRYADGGTQSGKTFILTSSVEDPAQDESEIVVRELSADEYKAAAEDTISDTD